MNVSMPIAAVMLDLGFPAAAVKAVPILARTAGLLAHLAEEQEQPIGFLMAGRAEEAIEYERAGRRRVMLDARGRGAAVGGAARADDASYREQLAYLFERSAFYRDKLRRPARRRGGRRPRRHRAAAAHREARAAGDLHGGEPDRRPSVRDSRPRSSASTPRAAPPARRATSRSRPATSTTGSPARRAATRPRASPPGSASSRTYNAGPFAAGAALAAFERIGLSHIPVGTGNTERLMRRSSCCKPEAVVLTPSYAAYLVEWAAERGVDLRGSSVERVLVAGEPGGGEPAFRAKLEEGWGARVTEAMGIGDIGVSLWGECEEQDGMHLGARGFVHAELIDPETGGAARRWTTARPASSSSRISATARRRSCASARATTWRCATSPVRVRPHRPARALHRPHRRHAHRPRRERLPVGRARGGRRVRSRR